MTAPDWVTANQAYLAAELQLLRDRLLGAETGGAAARRDELAAAMPAPPALHRIAAGFGLSGFERDTLLLAAGVELDAAVADACAKAQDDPVRRHATFGLALAVLPGAHWTAVSPAAPLRRWRLVEVAGPEPTGSPLRADERVLHALTGVSYLDPRLAQLAAPAPAAGRLPPTLRDAATRLAGHWQAGRLATGLYGRPRADLIAVAVAACAAVDLRPVLLPAAAMPAAPADRDLLARLCERETVLDRRAWIVEAGDRTALDVTERIGAPVVVVSRDVLPGSAARLTPVSVTAPPAAEIRTAWREALGRQTAAATGDWLDRVAGQFDLDLAAMQAVSAEIGDDPAPGPALWQACRRRSRPAFDDLTARIEPTAGWDDLVLPAPQMQALKLVETQVRHRLKVLEDWGFAERSGRGLGVAALFAGPSGTGKTLAAEVLAGALGLDLYRIDLSQVVSKYIGETEKNLRQVFDAAESGGTVLLFDEADALFGRRSEVRDSHDRYANIEVSYLLQRMETYRGLAVLTTNLKSALDTAFLRRLRFVVQFPFPDLAGRAEIWRRAFPARTPTDGLDLAKLARLGIAGGTIRNIALAAAFLAADEDSPVRMDQVLRATRIEYLKLEKPLTDTEVAGWTTTASTSNR